MPRKVLHLIAQAHLDAMWIWPWRDGCSMALTTLRSAVDRMREVPSLKFSRSSSAIYKWARDCDPALFEEIQRLVREGRWEIVNGWIEQPDCNLPSAESFARQSLYGKGFFLQTFGTDVAVGYNVDSFGHSWGLPQMLRRAGFKYYCFMRPENHELAIECPHLFQWESPDGSRVLTWRMPTHYCQSKTATPDDLEHDIRTKWKSCVPEGFDHGCFFLGVGDHGGGPTKRQLARILQLQKDDSLPELRFSKMADFFGAIETSPNYGTIPVIRNELQHHARGCYSAYGAIKSDHRRAERALYAAEAIQTLTADRGYTTYPREKLAETWETLGINQIHDVLGGTCIEPDYLDVRDQMGAVCSTANSLAVTGTHALLKRIDTTGVPENVVFLQNTLPWRRKTTVAFDFFVELSKDDPITHLAGKDGRQIPLQWCPSEASFGPHLLEWKKATAVIDLPPMGHTVLMLAHGPAPKVAPWQPSALVRHDRIGVLSLKTPAGTETLDAWTAASLAKGATFAVYPDPDDTWGHTVKSYSQHKLGAPELTSSETLTDGPVVRIIRQRARWKNSQIIMDIVNYREIAATEIRLRINWQEKLEVLKFEVPTVLQNPRVFAEITGGEIERKLNGHEEHCHNWVALEGTLAGKPATVAVLNDRTYSYDAETTTAGGVIRMTVLRSNYFVQHEPVSLPPNTDNPVLDQGWQERRFWLIADDKPHSELHLTRLARELTLPAEYAIDCAHPGTEPWDGEGLEVSPANIFLTGIKKPEQGEGRILRLQETSGKPTKALLRDPSTGLSKEVSLGAWEVRSYRVTGNKIQEVDMLERPL